MTRKQRREHIAPFILHSKAFGSQGLREETLEDGSIKFFFEGYASTTAKDGSGDIVIAQGIRLDRYKKNPIIKIGHKRGEENNIGITTDLEVRMDGLYIKGYAILSPEIDDHAKIIHGLRHGLIKGFSIGFGDVKTHYDKEKDAMIIDSLELYEISLVDIPDNPLTIAKAIDIYQQKFLSTNHKSLMDYNVGDIIVFDHKYTGREREDENEKKYLGKIIEKRDAGTIMRYDETMNGTTENPVVMLHIHKVINGEMVPTVMVWTFYANEITDVELYNDSMASMVKSLEKKTVDTVEENTQTEEQTTQENTEQQEETTEEIQTKSQEETEETEETEEVKEQITENTNTGENSETTEPAGNGDTLPENGEVVEKSLHMNTHIKALQDKMDAKMKEYDEAIETVSDFIVTMQKSMEEKHSDIAKTINTIVKTMSKIVIDSPLQYVKTEEKKQKPVSMLQKQLQAIKDGEI